MSQLRYQDIILTQILTTEFKADPVYTEDGIDYLYTQFELRCESLIHPSTIQQTNSLLAGMKQVELLNLLEQQLNQPRGTLEYSNGDQIILSSNAQSDIRNGPFPHQVKVTSIYGSETAFVSFTIRTALRQCCSNGSNPQYLSNRWRELVRIDEHFLSRKIRRGKLIVSATAFANPDSFRYLVCPAVPLGFQRIQSEYIVQSDGLALLYTFIDQELSVMPPDSTIQSDGEWIETIEPSGKRFAEFRLHLIGPAANSGNGMPRQSGDYRRLNEANLVQIGLNAALNRSQMANLNNPQNLLLQNGMLSGFIASLQVRAKLHRNEVSIIMKTELNPWQKPNPMPGNLQPLAISNFAHLDVIPWNPDGNTLASEIGGNSLAGTITPAIDPGFRSFAGLELVASALSDPCLQQNILQSNPGSGNFNTGISSAPQVGSSALSVNPAELFLSFEPLPEPWLDLQNDLLIPSGIYTEYQIQDRWLEKQNVVMIPSTTPSSISVAIPVASVLIEREVTWVAERIGQIPDLPSPNLGNTNLVLLSQSIQADPPVYVGPNSNTIRYRVHGVYRYGVLDPNLIQLAAPILPSQLELEGNLQQGASPISLASTNIFSQFVGGIIADGSSNHLVSAGNGSGA